MKVFCFWNRTLVPLKKDANGEILIGTVHGDFHDIGKNIVITMLRGVGFDVMDLGINVPKEKFVKMVEEKKPHILGLSALLTTTMPEMREVIRALEQSGCRNKLKIIVGGAPVNAKICTRYRRRWICSKCGGCSDFGKESYGRLTRLCKRYTAAEVTKSQHTETGAWKMNRRIRDSSSFCPETISRSSMRC